jgi:hypothetical protein
VKEEYGTDTLFACGDRGMTVKMQNKTSNQPLGLKGYVAYCDAKEFNLMIQ